MASFASRPADIWIGSIMNFQSPQINEGTVAPRKGAKESVTAVHNRVGKEYSLSPTKYTYRESTTYHYNLYMLCHLSTITRIRANTVPSSGRCCPCQSMSTANRSWTRSPTIVSWLSLERQVPGKRLRYLRSFILHPVVGDLFLSFVSRCC